MKMLKPEEAAAIARVTPKTIREWLRKGILPGVKIGKIWRIREEDLNALLSGSVVREAPQ